MTTLSIVTITYNDLAGLKATCRSVDNFLAKGGVGQHVEHVIVDGNSTDRTADFLREQDGLRDARARWSSEPDRGIYDAMNKGVAQASGDYVVFLNSGDTISADCVVDTVFSTLEGCSGVPDLAGAAFSSYIRFATRTVKIQSRAVRSSSPRMPTVHQSMFFKRAVLLQFPFDCSYRVCGDYQNFASIYASGLYFYGCEDVFAVFSAGGISSKSPLKLFLESSSITKRYFKPHPLRFIFIMGRLVCSLAVYQALLIINGVPTQEG